MSNEPNVSNTVTYRHHEIKFSMERDAKLPNGQPLPLWYIKAEVTGFLKPFKSMFLESVFYREGAEKSKELGNPQELLDSFVANVKAERESNAEVLNVTLDSVSVMWYSDGNVAIEDNSSLITLIKNLIDQIYSDNKDEVREQLKQDGWM